MNKIRVNELFPAWANGGGIMSFLWAESVTGEIKIPWEESGTTPLQNMPYDLDLAYHGNHSGDKTLAPIVSRLLRGEGGYTHSTEIKSYLSKTILRLFGENWNKQWETLSFVYNPIDNYNMEEVLEDDETITAYGKTTERTDNLSHTKTGTETQTPNVTETRTDNLSRTRTDTETATPNTLETRTPNVSTQETDSIYGFNSLEAVNTDKSQTLESGTETIAKTGTETKQTSESESNTGTQATAKTGTDTLQYNTTDTDSGTQRTVDGGRDTQTRTYTLTRSGNIGVTTTQQMITQQRELWMWNFFNTVVFPDIDSVLSLSVY